MTHPALDPHSAAQIVVVVYMLLMASIGAYYSRHMKTVDDYFHGSGAVPGWAAGISAYMTNFSAYSFVAIASVVFLNGSAGLLLETGPALAFYLGATLLATRWYRSGVTTPVEFLEERYGKGTRQVFAWLGIILGLIGSGMRIYALGHLIHSMLGFPLAVSIVGLGIIMLTYTVMGGVWAVIVTDVVQFIVLLVAVIPLFFVSLARVGWVSGLFSQAPQGYFSFPSGEYSMFWLGAWWLSYLLDYNGNWGVIPRFCITSSEREAKKAGYWAAALSVPHALLLFMPVLVAKIMMPEVDPESAYGAIAMALLPAGMVGIVAAAMLAATMSALDSSWNVVAAVLTKDIYKRLLRPRADDRELLLAGRVATMLVGVAATAVALTIALTQTRLFGMAQIVVSTIQAPTVLPFLMGILFPFLPRWSALAGVLIGLAAWWINTTVLAEASFAVHFAVSFSSVAGVLLLFSLLFPPKGKDRERITGFFKRLRQPAPAQDTTATDMPSPLRIIGLFTAAAGLLMFCMLALPQSTFDRFLTASAGLTVLLLGLGMRFFGKRQIP